MYVEIISRNIKKWKHLGLVILKDFQFLIELLLLLYWHEFQHMICCCEGTHIYTCIYQQVGFNGKKKIVKNVVVPLCNLLVQMSVLVTFIMPGFEYFGETKLITFLSMAWPLLLSVDQKKWLTLIQMESSPLCYYLWAGIDNVWDIFFEESAHIYWGASVDIGNLDIYVTWPRNLAEVGFVTFRYVGKLDIYINWTCLRCLGFLDSLASDYEVWSHYLKFKSDLMNKISHGSVATSAHQQTPRPGACMCHSWAVSQIFFMVSKRTLQQG